MTSTRQVLWEKIKQIKSHQGLSFSTINRVFEVGLPGNGTLDPNLKEAKSDPCRELRVL